MGETTEPVIHFEVNDSLDYTMDHPEEIKAWLSKIADNHSQQLASLEYKFCSDEQLLEVNRQYLNHDYFTDIITFPLDLDPIEACIYISVDRVKENANLYSSNFVTELHRVIVHGLLHLLGYNDKTYEENKSMRKAEDDSLNQRSFI